MSSLAENKDEINALNVFPIPDGDTGDNMLMTLKEGISAAEKSQGNQRPLSDVASDISKGMLLGARGNSGVILSRIFAGIAKGLASCDDAAAGQFSSAMELAVAEAYSSVSNPVEGTMLTVLREGVSGAEKTMDSLAEYFRELVSSMEVSLANTPELLPALKEAAVVDSGGAGLLQIFRGMYSCFEGKASANDNLSSVQDEPSAASSSINLDDFSPDTPLEFGYCTEVLLRLRSDKVADIDSFDESVIRDYLTSAGESVVCFRSGSVVKVHIHSFRPGDILSGLQRWGEFLTVKVENMTMQHNEATGAAGKTVQATSGRNVRKSKSAVVAVASGEGMKKAFCEAGVSVLVDGGQTMNPSSGELIEAFEKAGAETIYVLPNNSNIILSAKQAADIYRSSDVVVLPVKNPGTGYAVAASVDWSVNKDEVLRQVDAIVAGTVSGVVSTAIRDAALDGIDVKKGEYLGISGDKALVNCPLRLDSAIALAEKMGISSFDVAVIFKGTDVPAEEFETLVRTVGEKYPRCEIMPIDGGQNIFDYIITLC